MGQLPYHVRIIEHISRFGKENTGRYIGVDKGSVNPLYLTHPQARRKNIPPIQYEPDVYYTTKKKTRIVFEVLDSEYKKTSEIISDMIQCCLGSDIVLLNFIVPVCDEEVEKRIFDTYDVITDTLIHLGVNEDWIPDIAVYYVLPKESVSYRNTKRILSDLSRQDKW